MTENHPITPPPELVQQWLSEPRYAHPSKDGTFVVEKCHSLSASEVANLVSKAARWGFDQRTVWDAEWLEAQLQRARDQELEACCEWLSTYGHTYEVGLRAARRPNEHPPTADELIKLAESMRGIAVHEGRWLDELERVAQLLEQQSRALEQLDD